MTPKKVFISVVGICFSIVLITSCDALSGAQEQVENLQQTGESLSTSIKRGQDILETGEALVTDVNESGLIQTVQAGATIVKESGLLETAKAFATQQGPPLIETAQNIATKNLPGLQETISAAVTQLAIPAGETGTEIPLMRGRKEDLRVNQHLVSYAIAEEFTNVLTFYEREMSLNGWERNDSRSIVDTQIAIIHFNKDDSTAIVSLGVNPSGDKVIILVTVDNG